MSDPSTWTPLGASIGSDGGACLPLEFLPDRLSVVLEYIDGTKAKLLNVEGLLHPSDMVQMLDDIVSLLSTPVEVDWPER